MSRLALKYAVAAAETAVFWDVDSCPNPSASDLDVSLIDANIRSALQEHGYLGDVTIRAFSESNIISEEFLGTNITFVAADERDRAEQIMGDLYLRVTGHCKRANLMIISRHISDDLPTFVERITLLRSLGYHVIIAQPEKEKPSEALLSYVSFVWPWENLAAGRPPYDQTGSSQDDTVVFWDVHDCPVADDTRPGVIYDNIISALENMGYHGRVSISAYCPPDKWKHFAPFAKNVSGLVEASNLMIISSYISEDSVYAKCFHMLRSLNYKVLLANPQCPSGKVLETVVAARWLWESLSAGGPPMDHAKRNLTSCLTTSAVFWDVEDCPVASGLCPRVICDKIRSALESKDFGYPGTVSFMAYGERNKIRDDFTFAGITFVPAGDRQARATRIFEDLFIWAKNRREPSNLLIISRDIRQDSAYEMAFHVLWLLRNNVLIAQPSSSGDVFKTVTAQWLWESLSSGGPPVIHRPPCHPWHPL